MIVRGGVCSVISQAWVWISCPYNSGIFLCNDVRLPPPLRSLTKTVCLLKLIMALDCTIFTSNAAAATSLPTLQTVPLFRRGGKAKGKRSISISIKSLWRLEHTKNLKGIVLHIRSCVDQRGRCGGSEAEHLGSGLLASRVEHCYFPYRSSSFII